MKLLRLVLQGFKSFADKTTIEFADGMTVIVGPNGCGKSNISDAVRWVLGEQNIRNLRGQKSEDIIFSGAEGRNAKNAAEVTLVLDNSHHELPLDTVEVSITRLILRNGESDFRINKRSCRLKDIQELLAPTGIGRGSMAIIGQNRVDQVLMAHPEERRLIFEEVAGISLYRMRKNEGLRKLDRTMENMERVRDLMALLEEQLIPLKEAAEKAKAYKKLAKEKEAVEATMGLLKLTSIGRMLARYENEYRRLSDEKVEWDAKLSKFSLEKEELEAKALAHQEALRKMSADLADKQRRVEELRGDYRVKEEVLHHAEEETKRLIEEAEDQSEAEKELAEEIEAMTAELKEAEALFQEQTKRVKSEEEKKAGFAEKLATAEATYREKESAYRQKIKEKEDLLRQVEQGKADRNRLGERQKEVALSYQELLSATQALEKQIKGVEEKERALQQELQTLEKEGNHRRNALKEAEEEGYRLLQLWNDKNSEAVKLRSRREYIERADREYASFSKASKTVLENRSLWGSHVIGPLGELLHIPPKYTLAAEVALGAAISYIVTDTGKNAGDIIRWLKEHHAGRTTFYPLDAMKRRGTGEWEEKAAKESGICGIAADLFSYEEEYTELMEAILGKTLVAEDLEVARAVSQKYHHRLRLVTLDGQLVNPGGSLTGGSMRKAENLFFGRKQELNDLLRKEDTLEKEIKALKERRGEQEERCASLSDAVTEAREAWQNKKMELATLSGQKEGLVRTFTAQQDMGQKTGIEKDRIEKEIATVEAHLTEWEEALSAYEDIPDIGDDEESRGWKKAVEETEEILMNLRLERAKAEQKVNFCHRAEEERQRAKEEQEQDRKELEEKREENEKTKRHLEEELKAIQEAFAKAETEWKDLTKAQAELENTSDAFTIDRKQRDTLWREAQEKSLSIEKDLADRQVRIDTFRHEEDEEREKFRAKGLTTETAEVLRLSGTMGDMKEKESALDRQITALGPVNPNGEEEYEVQRRRRDFYETQIEDLKKAKTGLEKVIHDMDVTMEKEFKEAFALINKEFARIMKLMFSGGEARLSLTDEEHPLEGGVEMYLQLPGKKRQPLTLMSGGERALTVIALLMSFMAYRPAPFCFVDEIDAALDDANVERYSHMIGDYKNKTQFVIISHRKKTMEFADTLQGVTMAEKGVSSLVTVRVGDYIKEK